MCQQAKRHIVSDQSAEQLDECREHSGSAVVCCRGTVAEGAIGEPIQAVHGPGADSYHLEHGVPARGLSGREGASKKRSAPIVSHPTRQLIRYAVADTIRGSRRIGTERC